MLLERGLHGVQPAGPGDALDGGDAGTFELNRQQRAGFCGLAVEVDRAGPALAGVAADVGAGELQLLAQEVDQERARIDRGRDLPTVHGEAD